MMRYVDSFDKCIITDTHVKFLNMYLDGVANSVLMQFLTDEWFSGTVATKHHFDGFIRGLMFSLNMPFSKKDCIENKEQILVNLQLCIEYQHRLIEFKSSEEFRLKELGFKPMRRF